MCVLSKPAHLAALRVAAASAAEPAFVAESPMYDSAKGQYYYYYDWHVGWVGGRCVNGRPRCRRVGAEQCGRSACYVRQSQICCVDERGDSRVHERRHRHDRCCGLALYRPVMPNCPPSPNTCPLASPYADFALPKFFFSVRLPRSIFNRPSSVFSVYVCMNA